MTAMKNNCDAMSNDQLKDFKNMEKLTLQMTKVS